MNRLDLQARKEYEFIRGLIERITPGGLYSPYRDDPVGFARDVLGVWLTPDQEALLNALVEQKDARVVARSGHGIGKTYTVSIAGLWYPNTRDNAIVVVTAPTYRQVKSVVFREMRKMFSQSKKPLPGTFLQTEYYLSSSFVLGLSTDEPERFQGLHAEHILIVEDESPGVNPGIHSAIEGVLAGGGLWMKIGNPTSPSGPFYEAFRSPVWKGFHFSCLNHPNVTEDRTVIPGAVSKQWCLDRKKEWGESSPLYQSRVLGEFPTEGDDTLISLSSVEQAFLGELEPGEPHIVVCDVARFGEDSTVIAERRGSVYVELEKFNGKSLMRTVGRLKHYWDTIRPDYIVVDDDGLGAGATDRLEEQSVDVRPFRGGESASDNTTFYNRRSESWWNLREELRSGNIFIKGVPDPDDLKAQLTALTYDFRSDGRIFVESKRDAKKRGIKSPDRGDAMAMAYEPESGPMVF